MATAPIVEAVAAQQISSVSFAFSEWHWREWNRPMCLTSCARAAKSDLMQRDQLLELLKKVQRDQTPPTDAVEALAHMPFSDDGVAKVDHHRGLRCGFAEVVFGPGKRPEDLIRV